MSWGTDILNWARDQGPLANLLGIMSFMGAAGGTVYAVMKRRFQRDKLLLENAEARLTLKNEELAALRQERDQFKQYDPSIWLKSAEKERKDGNEEKAVAILRTSTMLVNDGLHETYLALARYHISIYPDQGETLQLQEAERVARIASLLRPDDSAVTLLLEEINETMVMENIHQGHYNPENLNFVAPDVGLYGGELGSYVVEQLLTLAHKHAVAGRYIFYERLAYRARCIELRESGKTSPLTLIARFTWAQALSLNGFFLPAITEIDSISPLLSNAEDADTQLAARHLRARILKNLGRYEEALREINSLLPIKERLSGTEHPETLAAHTLRAEILKSLERYEEALLEIDTLLPIRERISGAEHPDTLTARTLRAESMMDLGRPAEALREIDTLLPIRERVSGAEHPDTITTRYERASILDWIGHHEEALREIDTLLPIRERVSGAEHPSTLNERNLRVIILNALGRHEEALREIDSILPIWERVSGAEHPGTLIGRDLRARILDNLGRHEEALREIDTLLPIRERVSGAEHTRSIAARTLRAMILANLGR
ncbi:tetratricopeptide repeat protein [Nitrosospira sp. Nsp5]|uniref:Tetratricopeptide repeat-containing protein n=1 Tax=Nitrosospira multiformis TaxID=1231 RepID=A0ABY0TKL9_9PROT|nr:MULTISPECIES: tetratricopeptide repeat protein [Nitrosospira]PTR10063.1 tetratricopeptide repeat protein [Nitrosospira sp. Nsp5]SDQ98207.1 Tetratricopeptide repeat-containing protein [Nitrosospira multiformis]